MLQLYKNIKNRRLKLGMSQNELAEKTGYRDRSSIAKIEKGEVDLSQSKIELFANALGTTASELMGWDEKPEPEDMDLLADLAFDKELLTYIKKVTEMNDEEKMKVFNYIDFIIYTKKAGD